MPARSPRGRRGVALLLIDFLNPLDFPGAERMRKAAFAAARRTAALKRKARAAGISCIYCNDHFGMWDASAEQVIAAVEAASEEGARLVSVLGPERGDVSILKPRHSGFYGTPLEFLLDELDASTLVIAGIAVDMCVLATAQDAHMRKFKLRVPSNCVAGFNRAEERSALLTMERTLDADTTPFRT